jgi:hypothetical protein
MSDPENAHPKATPCLRVNKHPMGFLFPVVDAQSSNHDERNGTVVRRGSCCSILVICHVRVSMLPLDRAQSADQDKGICGGCGASLVNVEGQRKTAAGVSSPSSGENEPSLVMGRDVTRHRHWLTRRFCAKSLSLRPR